MALRTDPTAFSITALLADQVALVARNQKLPPGAASLLLRELMEGPLGRRRLLCMIEAERRAEGDAGEAAKIAVVLAETAAWIAELDNRTTPLAALEPGDGPPCRERLATGAPAHPGGSPSHNRRPPGIAWRRGAALRPALR